MSERTFEVPALAALEWDAGEPVTKEVMTSSGLVLYSYEQTIHSSTNGIWEIVQSGSGNCALYFRAWRALDSRAAIGGGSLPQAKKKAQLMQDILDLVWEE